MIGFDKSGACMQRCILQILVFLWCVCWSSLKAGSEIAPSVASSVGPPTSNAATDTHGSGQNAFIDLYQHWIAPARFGTSCSMHPSCSQYSKIAFDHLAPTEAIVLTYGRFISCGRDGGTWPRQIVDGKIKWLDPVPSAYQPRFRKGRYADAHVEPGPKAGQLADMNEAPKILPAATNASDYARFLIALGEYPQAHQAYLLALFSAKDELERQNVVFALVSNASAFMSLDEFRRFYYYLRPILQPTPFLFEVLQFTWIQKLLDSDQVEEGRWTLKLYGDTATAPLSDWYFLQQARLNIQSEQWDKAQQWLERLSDAALREAFLEQLFVAQREMEAAPYRSPRVAAALSAVVPGVGYVYGGRPSAGMAALVINGLFIWTATEAFREKNYGLGTTTAVLGAGWYLGNIRGAVKAAQDHNSRQRHHALDPFFRDKRWRQAPTQP